MTINFYNCGDEAKRVTKTNIALILSSDGEIVKDSSILSPRVRVKIENASALQSINYAFIPYFNRFYYVSDPIWLGGDVFEYTFKVDVLMSHKGGIYNSSAFVLRCADSENINPLVNDGIYSMRSVPQIFTKAAVVTEGSWLGSEGFAFHTPGEGSPGVNNYIMTAVGCKAESGGADVGMFGAVYLRVSKANISTILSEMTGSWYLADNVKGFTDVYWLPVTPTTLTNGIILKFPGLIDNLSLPGNVGTVSLDHIISSTIFTCDISDYIDDRYPYINQPPYRKMSVRFLPFGTFELDTGYLHGETSIKFKVDVNVISGVGTLYYCRGSENMSDTTKKYLATASVKISTLLSTATSNSAMVASSLMKAGAGAFAGMLTGGVGTALAASAVMGASGSMLSFNTNDTIVSGTTNGVVDHHPVVNITQYTHTERDISKYGAPCCKERALSMFVSKGFVQCGEIDLHLPGAYSAEYSEVESWLQSGVYL